MFVSAIKKAHDAVEGLAVEAAFGIAAVLLGCIALLFAAAGAAMWLSTIMPVYFALLVMSVAIALIAAMVYFLGQNEFTSSQKKKETEAHNSSPLNALTKSFGSMAAPMDLVASGLFARQFKKAPIATVAATAAVGALASMIAAANQDDEE
ncbi:MAG: phage holin family protein [Pseudomonadota bacterium]